MHTYESHGVTFQFNSDWSGELQIGRADVDTIGRPTQIVLRIPAEAILNLVAEKYVKTKMIEKIENTDYKNILLN